MKKIMLPLVAFACLGMGRLVAEEAREIQIGSERQLFLDDEWLLASMENVEIRVHSPVRRELVDVRNRPWEGSGCKFHSVLFDPETKRYQMYYTATAAENVRPWDVSHMHVAYLESSDGIHWPYKPLRLCDWNGSKENNLILMRVLSFSPFIDGNPQCPPEERYKGVSSDGHGKMSVWTSPDGIRWHAKNDGQPVYVPGTPNAFDSQNVAFWSETEGRYVVYYRVFDPRRFRSAERAVSDDFIHWKKEAMIQMRPGDVPTTNHGEFYTNQILPYDRAPQLYIGFPARYTDHGETASFRLLPEQEERAVRMRSQKRFGTVTTDSIYIVSHDGVHFSASNDVFLAPGLKSKDNWSYGDNYIAHGLVETDSTEADAGRELSLYATESAFTADDTRCRRYTLRLDGFASLHARTQEGKVVTQPLIFKGQELSLNAATSGFGHIRVEICRADGTPVQGFAKQDCDLIYGDSLDRRVSWKGAKDVSALEGKPVILVFYLCEADIYSLKFEP